jgi:large subunit ribosomal protein L17
MRHSYYGRNLSRPVNKRLELFKSLLNETFRVGKIETTLTKAKAVSGEIDKLISMAKKQTVAARANLEKTLTPDVSKKLFREVKEKLFAGRNSGYSRIIRLGRRFSDDTEMVELSLIKDIKPAIVDEPVEKTKTKKSKTNE